jgi:hypothetical protein
VALQWVIQLAPSLATLGAAWFGLLRGQGKLRRNLRHDVEVAKELPDDFEGKKILMQHIERQISTLHSREVTGAQGGRRDWTGTILGIVLALVGGYGTVWFFSQDPWWKWIGLVGLAPGTLGLIMIAEGLRVTKRNANGRIID